MTAQVTQSSAEMIPDYWRIVFGEYIQSVLIINSYFKMITWNSGYYDISFNIFGRSEFLNIVKMIYINSNLQSRLLVVIFVVSFCVREDIFDHLESLQVASSSVISVSSLIQVTSCCFTTESHPCPPKPDPAKSLSSSLNNLTPAKFTPVINNGSPTILGKRSYEQHNGMDGKYFSAVCPLRA